MRACVWMLAGLLAVGRSVAQPAPAADSMASIAWLAGDWEADSKTAAVNTTTPKVAYHFHPILGGTALSIETTFNAAVRLQGLIAYDPARKSVVVWYLTASGDSTIGTMSPGDGFALFDLTVTSPEGKSTHLQLHIVHLDADHYHWEIYADAKGTGMTKLVDTAFHRVR